jgi:hypothetical protein
MRSPRIRPDDAWQPRCADCGYMRGCFGSCGCENFGRYGEAYAALSMIERARVDREEEEVRRRAEADARHFRVVWAGMHNFAKGLAQARTASVWRQMHTFAVSLSRVLDDSTVQRFMLLEMT